MKPALWIALLAVAALGLGIGMALEGMGVGRNSFELSPHESSDHDHDEEQQYADAPPLPPGPEKPKVVVPVSKFHFGQMVIGSRRSHEFVIRNEGDYPLMLKLGATTCKCTLSELENDEIPPGEEAIVTLEWKGERTKLPEFHQEAAILTNDVDNRRLIFEIDGKLVGTIVTEPSRVVWTKVRSDETRATRIQVYSSREVPLEIRNVRFEDPATADYFDAKVEPLEHVDIVNAKSGFAIVVELKSGLELGDIEQKLVLETNFEDSPEYLIPIHVSIASDIEISGEDYVELGEGRGVVRIGQVHRAEGADRTVRIHVRGDHRKGANVRLKSASPDFMEVELGDMRELNRGKVLEHTLTIRVPPNAPITNYLGGTGAETGHIVVELDHPQLEQIELDVRFAVHED